MENQKHTRSNRDQSTDTGNDTPLKEKAPTPSIPFGDHPKVEDGKFEIDQQTEKHIVQVVRRALHAESFEGPTPPPKHLEQYEKILPGSAKMIFDQFEKNAEHQRSMEERQMTLSERAIEFQGRDNADASRRDARGQLIAGGLVVFGLLVALAFGYFKQGVVAGLIVTSLLVAVLTGYLRKDTPIAPPPSTESGEDDDK
ncbi:hypothetical protein PCO31111_04176 [Pandoraea communis]|uniref:DUF2335 domain-containing protein n=1 Tax=Pandoraea communis TaxID=2508297 RepID=A0A5E4XXK2_9BURK|nr:DUF2335 domain-containing protein [Pandoraea communis]VVE41106.1 hypothetical protein PCO31111_04176 [Pandoraea communis]